MISPVREEQSMSRRPCRNHSAAFEAKVALAALKGDRTLAEDQAMEGGRGADGGCALRCRSK